MSNEVQRADKEGRRGNFYLGAGLALLLTAAAFFSGIHIGSGRTPALSLEAGLFSFFTDNSKDVGTEEQPDLTEFWRVWNLLDEKFVRATTTELSNEDKIQGAISGLVKAYGDPYTVYMPPTEAEAFGEEISGNFSGVGMEVGLRDDIVTVIAPLPETPAFKAGVLSGDKIVKIDEKSTEGMSADEAVQLIRGEKGTTVTLTIYREGATDFEEITIVRDTITIPTTKTELHGDAFVIALYSFNALSEMKMQEAMREYVESGATKLILDLRGNPGGYLQSAVAIASYFLPAGEVVVREQYGAGEGEDIYRSQGKTLRDHAPESMVVLVDGGSASASEILAGALKEHDAATIIGATTFGKGSVQELVDLPDGSSLKVTIARWLTPDGHSISEQGLEPNVTVERTVDQVLAGEDPQLEAALRWVSGDHSIAQSLTE